MHFDKNMLFQKSFDEYTWLRAPTCVQGEDVCPPVLSN